MCRKLFVSVILLLALTSAASAALEATNPSPADDAEDVSIDVVLSWDPGHGAVMHDVYFGTSSSPPFIGKLAASSYDPGTLEPGTIYFWRIDEFTLMGTNPGPVWSFTTMSAPVEATNPYPADGAEDVDPNMLLSWDPGHKATSHDVYFGTSSPPAFIGNQTANDYDPGTLEPGVVYYWQIDTVRQIGEFFIVYTGSVWSFTTEATPPPPPSEPTNPSPSDGATDQSIDVGLSWSNGGGATSYKVYFGTDPTPDSSEYKGSQTGTSYNPGTLNYDTTYYWRTDALNSSGTTTGSVWSFTTEAPPPPPPSAPTNPGPSDGATDQSIDVDLSWSNGGGATSYKVYFGTDPTPDSGEYKGSQTGTSYNPGTLNHDTTYYWRIDATNSSGNTTGSVWSFTTSGPVKATNPSPADGAEDVPTDVVLSWNSGYGATSHDVYFDTSSPPAFIGNQTANDYDPGTLEPDVRYYWQINEVNNLDPCSPWQGDIWRFKTVSATDPNEPNEPKWKTGYKGYYTTDEENTVEVPCWTKPWNKADSNNQITVTLKSGEYIWFAFINLDDANKSKRKYFQLILKGDAVSNLEKPEEVKGFEDNDDKKEVKVRRCGGPRWGRHEGKVTRRFRYKFGPPQPLWERFKFKAKNDITGETITIMAWSICCRVEYWKGGTWPTLPEVKSFGIGGPGAESGVLGVTNIEDYAFSIWDASFLSQSPGAVIGDPRITDIYVFPDSSTVNTLVPPNFSADPSTGNWTASFVYTDPNGDSRSQGGVLFASDGPGLGTSDRFNLQVFVAGLIDSTYELYAYDQDSGQYMDFGIDVDIPECNEVVDDMESYTDDLGNRIFETWKDGYGYGDIEPGYPGNGTGSRVDLDSMTVHGGALSMRVTYDNESHILDEQLWPKTRPPKPPPDPNSDPNKPPTPPPDPNSDPNKPPPDPKSDAKRPPIILDSSIRKAFYSEAERTFDTPQDWTRDGVKALALWFTGDPNNDPEPMYVAVEDNMGMSKLVNHANPNAVLSDMWEEWNIDLREFSDAGVDLTNVNSIAIGVGDRAASEPRGTGTMYFDDIRLCPTRCVPEYGPFADFTNDCVVDFADLRAMAGQWLDSTFGVKPDLNWDGIVDFGDYARLADMWLCEQEFPCDRPCQIAGDPNECEVHLTRYFRDGPVTETYVSSPYTFYESKEAPIEEINYKYRTEDEQEVVQVSIYFKNGNMLLISCAPGADKCKMQFSLLVSDSFPYGQLTVECIPR